MKSVNGNLILVLGDQLDEKSSAFDGFDVRYDTVWMAEVEEESTHVWSHKARIVLFLSAMRHFRDMLLQHGIKVIYHQLDDHIHYRDFAGALTTDIEFLSPKKLIVVQPGEWRVEQIIRQVAKSRGVQLEVRPDRHFLCSKEEFEAHTVGRRQLRMEFFYRTMRKKYQVLMDGDRPVGGKWNFDEYNRQSFKAEKFPNIHPPLSFSPDKITSEVIKLVNKRFNEHPGSLEYFDWPVTKAQAQEALADFIENRLPNFGAYQDAMWSSKEKRTNIQVEDTFLYHSRLSAAMNLKLLDPREVIMAVEHAYQKGHAPLTSVEGFIRQVLGWREYVRGIYWQFMPEYGNRNALDNKQPLPKFYWTAHVDMDVILFLVETLTVAPLWNIIHKPKH